MDGLYFRRCHSGNHSQPVAVGVAENDGVRVVVTLKYLDRDLVVGVLQDPSEYPGVNGDRDR